MASLPLLQNGRMHLNRKRDTTVDRSWGTLLEAVRRTTLARSVLTPFLFPILPRTVRLRGFRTLILFPWNRLLLGRLSLLTLLSVIPLQTLWTLVTFVGNVELPLARPRHSPVNLSNCVPELLLLSSVPLVVLMVLRALPWASCMFLTLPAVNSLLSTERCTQL